MSEHLQGMSPEIANTKKDQYNIYGKRCTNLVHGETKNTITCVLTFSFYQKFKHKYDADFN